MNMATISHLWNIVIESNLFNFIIFVLIFAWIFHKIDVKGIISNIQQKIIKLIDDVKKNKEDAYSDLVQAQKDIENLDSELKVIVDEARNSANVLSEKILTEAKKQVEDIEANAQKVIDAEEKMLIAKLTKSTSHSSVKAAEEHIKNVLVQTPTLHEKYINESIDELDRLNF